MTEHKDENPRRTTGPEELFYTGAFLIGLIGVTASAVKLGRPVALVALPIVELLVLVAAGAAFLTHGLTADDQTRRSQAERLASFITISLFVPTSLAMVEFRFMEGDIRREWIAISLLALQLFTFTLGWVLRRPATPLRDAGWGWSDLTRLARVCVVAVLIAFVLVAVTLELHVITQQAGA